MNNKYAFNIAYTYAGKKYTCTDSSCEHFTLNLAEKDSVISLSISPKVAVSFSKFNLIIPYTYNLKTEFM